MDEPIKIPTRGMFSMFAGSGYDEIKTISIDLIDDYPNHPYPVKDDDALAELADSIAQNGQLEPAIVRDVGNGRYQLLSGHRRKLAHIKICDDEMRAVVLQDITDDQAKAIMLNCNVRRDELLPSEKARIYYEKKQLYQNMDRSELFDLSAMFGSLNCNTTALLAKESEESEGQVKRYIRLHTRASDKLKAMVDSGEMSLRLADELTSLTYDAQNMICDILREYSHRITCEETALLKQLDDITKDTVLPILGIACKIDKPKNRFRLSVKKIRSYFPEDYTPEQIEETLYGLLEQWQQSNEL